jgi:two-component system nitrate/nitrite response regulator NarL
MVVGTCIANDVIRHGIDAVLSRLPGVAAVHHCAGPAEVPAALFTEHYDVLITAGREWAVPMGELAGQTRLLVLVDEAEAEEIARSMPTADGFLLTQELTAEQLGNALNQLALGEMVLPSSLARRLLTERAPATGQRGTAPARLTDRQLAALRLMADGLSNKQIARRLEISEHGVKRLVTSIMLKLGAPNRTAAVLAGMRRGVIPAPRHETTV